MEKLCFILVLFLKQFYQTCELLCRYILSFFQRTTEKKALPHFCSNTLNVKNKQFLSIAIRCLCCKCISIFSLLTFLSSSFFMLTYESHIAFVLILRYKSGLSFASTRPRLMLFETGDATSVDHHHWASSSLLSLVLQHSWLLSAGLSSLQCCTSGIMKWMLKTHIMGFAIHAKSTAPHHWSKGFVISCREVTASHSCNAILPESLNGLTVLVYFERRSLTMF